MVSTKKSVTMSDVAEYAGVSLKTVSNVVNDWPYVSDETRRKVQDAIEAVGYRPNQMARSLVTGETTSIGVLIPDISNTFFGSAIRGCEDVLYENEYSIFLCNTSEEIERERFYLNQLMSRAVDGLILWGTRICCQELSDMIDEDISLVTVDMAGSPLSARHVNINVDSEDGAALATNHLIQLGYRRIAHIGGPEGRVTADRRLRGYRRALEESGMQFESKRVVSERPSIRGGYRAALTIFEDWKPQAIFCYNDLMAIGAMVAAKQNGMRLPEDLALVGFDDIAMASVVVPSLTTVHIAQYQLGRLTGETVLEYLRGEREEDSTAESTVFPVELVARESSGAHCFTGDQRKDIFDKLVASLPAEHW